LVGLLVVLVVIRDDPTTARAVAGFTAVGAVLVALTRRPAFLAAGTAVIIIALSVLSAPSDLVVRVRTFFGVIEVTEDLASLSRTEYSGTTLHGVEFLDARSREPTTYYVRDGPLGDAFDDLRGRTEAPSIAIVGLGIGTTAAYGQAGDTVSFYEIDPAVVEIASDPSLFTYLSDAPVSLRIVLGDARLSLAAEPAASVDLLVLDAFSSDSVPAHLLTREAMADYQRVLRPGGIAIFHLSNRYYDLPPAVASTAESIGLRALTLGYQPDPASEERLAAKATQYVVVGEAGDVARFADLGWVNQPRSGPVLTDDFFDTLRLLRPDAL
jgi:SAM-dependent methyltransferase